MGRGLVYLHEEYEQVVVHIDVKAGNVLLDDELNGRLCDFGLARLYDHRTDPQTTHATGTSGFLAPESMLGLGKPKQAPMHMHLGHSCLRPFVECYGMWTFPYLDVSIYL